VTGVSSPALASGRSVLWHCYPHPINLHEYQKKRLTEFAFRKLLILNNMLLVIKQGASSENAAFKKKREPVRSFAGV
jgi:hypothetical protein